MVSAQSALDDKIKGLVLTMGDSCSFADNIEELKHRSDQFHTIAGQILQQVMECGFFIRDYCKDTSFGKSVDDVLVLVRSNDALTPFTTSYPSGEECDPFG